MITANSVRDIPTNAIRAVTQPDGTILVYMPGDTLPSAPQPDPAALLAEAKASGHARIETYARAQRVKIAGTSDDGEMAGWVNKLRIAQAIQAGTAAPHEIAAFEAEIAARAIPDETLTVFVGKVLRNAGFFGHASGLVDGIKRHAQDAVNAATTPAEVDQALTQAQASAEAAFAQMMAQVAA